MNKPLKCSSCNQALAGVFVLDIENGFDVRETTHLCDECATNLGVLPGKIPLQALLAGAANLGQAAGARRQGQRSGPTCPGCQLTQTEFKLRGRLGCPRCYETFRDALLPLLERVHDATCHRGRCPAGPRPALRVRVDLAELQRRLDAAIAGERYEEAAALRDRILHAGQHGADAPEGESER